MSSNSLMTSCSAWVRASPGASSAAIAWRMPRSAMRLSRPLKGSIVRAGARRARRRPGPVLVVPEPRQTSRPSTESTETTVVKKLRPGVTRAGCRCCRIQGWTPVATGGVLTRRRFHQLHELSGRGRWSRHIPHRCGEGQLALGLAVRRSLPRVRARAVQGCPCPSVSANRMEHDADGGGLR